MPRALDDLLRQTTFLTLAAAIANGWSAVELAQATSTTIAFVSNTPDRLIAFALVVGTVMLVIRRRRAL